MTIAAKDTKYIQALIAHRKALQDEYLKLAKDIAGMPAGQGRKAAEARQEALKKELEGTSSEANIVSYVKAEQENRNNKDWKACEQTLQTQRQLLEVIISGDPLKASSIGLEKAVSQIRAEITILERQYRPFNELQDKLHGAISAISDTTNPNANAGFQVTSDHLDDLPFSDTDMVTINGHPVSWSIAKERLTSLQDAAKNKNIGTPEQIELETYLRDLHAEVVGQAEKIQNKIEIARYQQRFLEQDLARAKKKLAALEADQEAVKIQAEDRERIDSYKTWRWVTLGFGFVWALLAVPLLMVFALAPILPVVPLVAVGLGIFAAGFLPFVLEQFSEKSNGTPFGKYRITAMVAIPALLGFAVFALGGGIPAAIIAATATFLVALVAAVVYYGTPLLTKTQQGVLGVLLIGGAILATLIIFGPGALALGAGFVAAQFLVAIIPLTIALLAGIRLAYAYFKGPHAPDAPKPEKIITNGNDLSLMSDDDLLQKAEAVAPYKPALAARGPAIDTRALPPRRAAPAVGLGPAPAAGPGLGPTPAASPSPGPAPVVDLASRREAFHKKSQDSFARAMDDFEAQSRAGHPIALRFANSTDPVIKSDPAGYYAVYVAALQSYQEAVAAEDPRALNAQAKHGADHRAAMQDFAEAWLSHCMKGATVAAPTTIVTAPPTAYAGVPFSTTTPPSVALSASSPDPVVSTPSLGSI